MNGQSLITKSVQKNTSFMSRNQKCTSFPLVNSIFLLCFLTFNACILCTDTDWYGAPLRSPLLRYCMNFCKNSQFIGSGLLAGMILKISSFDAPKKVCYGLFFFFENSSLNRWKVRFERIVGRKISTINTFASKKVVFAVYEENVWSEISTPEKTPKTKTSFRYSMG